MCFVKDFQGVFSRQSACRPAQIAGRLLSKYLIPETGEPRIPERFHLFIYSVLIGL